jgi:hypothetical protein
MGEQIREVNPNSVQPATGCNDSFAEYRNSSNDKKKQGLTFNTTDVELAIGGGLLAVGGIIALQKIDGIGSDINGISSTLTKDLGGAESILQSDFTKATTLLQGGLTNTTSLLQGDFTKATTLLQGDFTKATTLATQGIGLINSDLQAAKPPAETTINNTTINKTTIDKTTTNNDIHNTTNKTVNHKDIIIERKPGVQPKEPAHHPGEEKSCAPHGHTKAPTMYNKLGTAAHVTGPIASPGLGPDVQKVSITATAPVHPHDFRTALFAPQVATVHASVAGLKGVTGDAKSSRAGKGSAHVDVHIAGHPGVGAHMGTRMPHMRVR